MFFDEQAGVIGQMMEEITLAEVNGVSPCYTWGKGTVVHIAKPTRSAFR